jgi:hypothetical protein
MAMFSHPYFFSSIYLIVLHSISIHVYVFSAISFHPCILHLSSVYLHGFQPSLLHVSHPVYFFLIVRSCGRSGVWPRFLVGREAVISASHHRRCGPTNADGLVGDGPARLNAGGPLDVLRLGSALPPHLFLVCV